MVVRSRGGKEGGKEDCVRRYLVSGRAMIRRRWFPAFVLVKEDCREGYSIEGVSVIKDGGEEEELRGEPIDVYANGEMTEGKFSLMFTMKDRERKYMVYVKFSKWKPKTASVLIGE